MKRRIREFEIGDINLMISYFREADHDFLEGMGADPSKLPPADEWRDILREDFGRPVEQKEFYYVIWEVNGESVGHSNINKIIYGQEAYIHLHLWTSAHRKSGHGAYFVNESISRYFEKFQLQNLFCEPYVLNPAPNRTLPKIGFELVKTYETTPGWINFKQQVNRWVLTREKWLQQSQSLISEKRISPI